MSEDRTMRVAAITGPQLVELREIPVPKPAPTELLVRVRASALCTWEQRTYSGVDRETRMPFVGGHEYAGEVVEIGPEARTELRVGDKVAVGPRGLGRFEGHDYLYEFDDLWGTFGLAEYRAMSVGRAYRLADDLPLDHGSLTEPLACVIRSMSKLDIGLGQDVVVVGAGVMGLLNLMVAKLRGARVIVSEVEEARLDYAAKLGADATVSASEGTAPEQVRELTAGKGADAVIVAIGNHRANLDALAMVGEHGTVMLFASAHPPTDLEIDPNFIHRRQVTLTGSRHPSVESFNTAADLLSKRLVDVEPLIEARVPLDEIERALELSLRPDTFRIVVTM